MKIYQVISKAYYLPRAKNIIEAGCSSPGMIESVGWINNGSCVCLVEPNPVIFRSLLKTFSNKKNVSLINCALSDKTGQTKLLFNNKYHGWGYTDFSESNDMKLSRINRLSAAKVDAKTYDQLQKDLDIVFDIFIMDVEGSEDIILKQMKDQEQTRLPKVLCIECGYEWEKRKALVKNLGYNLDFYFFNNAYFSLDNSFKKNTNIIDSYNQRWKQWSYRNRIIYTNEKSND